MHASTLRSTRLLTAFTLATAVLVPQLARANSCTVNPMATLTLNGRAAPLFSNSIAGSSQFTVGWTVNAQHDAECSNMTEGSSVTFHYAADPTTQILLSPDTTTGTPESGTAVYTNDAIHIVASLSGGCDCGILGGPTTSVDTTDLVVPPTIPTGFVGWYASADPGNITSMDTPSAEMTVPVGTPIRVLGVAWSATITAGETVTEVADVAGARTTNVITYDGSNHNVSGAFQFDIPRDHVGDVHLYVEFAGTRSNELVLHVGAGGTSNDAGSSGNDAGNSGGDAGTSSDSGTTGAGRGGCAVRPGRGTSRAWDFGMVALAVFSMGALRRRRAST